VAAKIASWTAPGAKKADKICIKFAAGRVK